MTEPASRSSLGSIRESARQLDVIHQTDVLVVGEGPRGLAAARAATHKREWVEAVRIARDILGQPATAPLIGREISPNPAVQTDEQIVRVVDASAMRYVTNGDICAPVMMMVEKAADLIMGNIPLPPEDVPYVRTS